ncbi:type I-G CRISPR-associated protein Csb2 [Verrucomicrobium spinosum]|uniref:type I-G CRISPR-associated protein Csb2 n=1 Tax=Verrucomicrobium spinosum TaxID=2736 RepID=UPI00094621D1|nr:type I-U CRISPR-associated protein Csb2 [Verrucomicrobium spinosum]
MANLQAPASKKTAAKKAASKKAARSQAKLPSDVFAALHADTSVLQAAGWNLPPGAVFTNYTRPVDVFAAAPRESRASSKSLPTVARYQVVSNVSPRITQAVSVADRVHKSLCSFMADHPASVIVFSGKNAVTGEPLSGQNHAFIFCEANGKRDEITHITVFAETGFDDEARIALRRLNKVWGYGGHDIRLVLVGLGDAQTFPDCKLFAASKVWHSLTLWFQHGTRKLSETEAET